MWKLNNLWLNATKFVPYYREMAKNKHLPLKFHNLDEFRCLVPVLFKNAQSNSRALLSGSLCTCLRGDQHLVGNGFDGGGDAEDGPEGGLSGSAAVEAEDEFIEVGLQVRS